MGLCLVPARLAVRERAFVLFAGLKGAVPILLGSFILAAHVPDAERLYGIVVVVVLLSVLVQGGLVPAVAGCCGCRCGGGTRAVGARGAAARRARGGAPVHRGGRRAGRRAPDRRAGHVPEDAWISLVVRADRLLPVRGDSRLQAGDEVLVLADPDCHEQLAATFGS